jgi:hypothetical protein
LPHRCKLDAKDSCADWNNLGWRGIRHMVQVPGQETFIYAATKLYILLCSTERKDGCKKILMDDEWHDSYGLGYFTSGDGSKYIYAGVELNSREGEVERGNKVLWFRS